MPQLRCCRYEEERLPRVKTLHMKGTDGSSPEEKEKYMYKPTFKPLWCKQVYCLLHVSFVSLFGVFFNFLAS